MTARQMMQALLDLEPAACPQLDQLLAPSLQDGEAAMAILEMKVVANSSEPEGFRYEMCLTLLDPQETADYLASEAELERYDELPDDYVPGAGEDSTLHYRPD